jgi:hypothetical protein
MNSALRSLTGAVVLAVATVLTWYLWLGRDTGYQIDANGVASGPYTTGQVVGCVLTMFVLLVAAVLLRVHPLIAAAAMTIAFTVAWTAQAGASDETGLFLVGAILVFGGCALGTSVVAFATYAIRRRAAR